MDAMNTPLMVALRGPALMITLGVLFMGGFSGDLGFLRTWPVLIIVYGLMRLLERVFRSGETHTTAGGGLST